jgi:ABC-2 type transport system permease protein
MAVLAALVLPAVTGALVSAALGNEPRLDGTVAVVDLDGGPAAQAFREEALGDPRVTGALRARVVESAREAEALVERGEVDAGIVIPAGFTAGLAGGGPPARPTCRVCGRSAATSATSSGGSPAIRVLRDDGPSIEADLAQLVVDSFTRQARAVALGGGTAGDPSPAPALAVEAVAPGGRPLDAATHYGPSVGLFFVMVALGYAVDTQVTDRHLGVADRLAATTAPAGAVLAARALAALALGLLSLGVTAVTMQAVFGRSWGPPATVVALAVAAALAYAGVAAVMAAVIRTPGQAQGAGAAIAFLLALAGGSLAPPGAATLRLPFAGLLPSTAAIDGFALATTERAGVGGVLPVLVALAGTGAALLLLAPVLAPAAARPRRPRRTAARGPVGGSS